MEDRMLQTLRESLPQLDLELPEDVKIIPFSAEKGDGRDELVRAILAAVKE